MAQCQADHKKHSTSRFDLYGGIFSGQHYGASAVGNGHGHIDRMQSLPSFASPAGYNVGRMNGGSNFAHTGPDRSSSYREESFKSGMPNKSESPNGFGPGGKAGGVLHEGGLHDSPKGGFGNRANSGLDRRRSTGGIGHSPAPMITPEASPPSSNNKGSRNAGSLKEPSGTPPFHSRKSSGEISSDRVVIKGIPDDIIKGVGNLLDDLSSGGGLKSSDLDSGSSTGSKGRSTRAESPKSIGSSSSGGSTSSGGSPTVGRVVNFGNILPSGGCPASAKNGSSPNGTSVSGRGLNGHAPLPVPISGALKGSRRSNSWDYSTGTLKPSSGSSRSGPQEAGGGQQVGINPKGSLSTSPSGSLGSAYVAQQLNGGYGNIAYEGENLRKALLASTDAEEVKQAANEQYKKGNFEEALNLYDQAISLAPEKAAYRSNRAAALTGLGRLPDAVQECLVATRLDPLFGRAHHRLASLYLRLGQVDNALKHFKATGTPLEVPDTQRCQTIEKHLRKCNEARKAQNWHSLIRETDAAIIAGADSAPQVLAFKAEAMLKLHRPEEADAVMANFGRFGDMLKRSACAPTNKIVLLVQAQIDMALGRFDAAVVAVEKASLCAPQDTAVTILMQKARAVAMARKLGNDYYNYGKFAEATTAYGEGLEAAPGNAVLLCNRAACRSKLNQWEKAVEDCNAALEAQPSYTKALLRRAHSYWKLERWEDALRDYEVLRRELPGDAAVARAHFDVQVAQKKAKGEETYKIRFGGEVEEVNTNDRFREAITAPGLAVVQFSTRWSERCKHMSPFVDDLCKRFLSINFLKVDVDDLPYLAKLEDVSFVPTFKIYKNGSKVKEMAGPTEQDLERAVNQFSM